MKKEIKGFVLGVLTTIVIGSGAAIAAGQWTTIDVIPNNVDIVLRGQVTDIPSFTYNDSTYVQLRPVLEGIDCVIDWDATTNSVYCYNRYETSWRPAELGNTGKQYHMLLDMESWPAVGYVPTTMLHDAGMTYQETPDTFCYYSPFLY